MGLVINPTAFRIGHVKTWTDAWYLHRMHYPVFVHKSLEIKTLLQYILLHKYPSQWSHWIYSHTTYYYFNNKFYVNLFVYDGNDPHNYFVSAKDHKYGWFKKSKFNRFWTKRQLLDLQFLYQRWFLLCQVMNLEFEDLELDSLKWRVKKRGLRKIQGLKKKYGRTWVAREELFVWKFPIALTSEDSYNKMGITVLNLLYKLYIMPKIRSSFKSPNFDLVDTANHVLKSHKILYFFFSYIDRILKIIPSYPIGLFNKLTYKACYKFFRMYFIFKPYWTNLSKLYELVLLYINVNSKVKIFLLDNVHLNASYMARYIMTCLRLKFDYRDTMIPIKKTLLKIMFAKRWRPIKEFKKKNWKIYLERYKHLLKDRIHFHFINSDLIKMFVYRLFFLKRLKKLFKKSSFRKFTIFNFRSLRLNLFSLKKLNYEFFCKKVLLNYSEKNKLYFKKFNNYNFLLNLKLILKKKFNILNKIKNISFIFFNIKKIKKNKFFKFNILTKFKLKRNIFCHLKKIYFYRLNLYLFQRKKIFFLRNIFFSFFIITDLINKIDVFSNQIKLPVVDKFYKLNIKSVLWMKKRRRLKRKLLKFFKARYKRKYKTTVKFRRKLMKPQLLWRYVKRWTYTSRKKMYKPLKKISWKFKIFNLQLNILPIIKFKFKNIIINYFFKFNYFKNLLILFVKKINFFILFKNFYFLIKNKNKFFSNYIIKRGFSSKFFVNYFNSYSNCYKPFVFNIFLYKNYIMNLLKPYDVDSQFIAKKPKKYDLEEMPLKDKFKRLRTLESGSRSLLFGYKFHFVGRFTRKQKAASLWFAKGANSVSSMRVDIDYGFHTIALRYSACTLKVWLYRNRGFSFKYGYRLV